MTLAANSKSALAPRFPDMFTPKLVTVFREGYSFAHLRADAIAGATVAFVALPLSMAIAIGSGAKPENGLYTSIVGGFLISALGGSRFQIGGPAAAFITLVAATTETFGLQGLMLATMMAGALMLAIGYLKLGAYVKYIPHPVTVGFTAGIALTIGAGQIHDLLGVSLASEPAAFLPKLEALWGAKSTISPAAAAMSAGCVGLYLAMRKIAPTFPGVIVVIAGAAAVAWGFNIPVETIGSRFGEVPSLPPLPGWPNFPLARAPELIPSAFAIAMLGCVESLLSAVVADGMTGRRHRSNCELVAQGYANIACGLFGGICATGTVARTATNIRSRAHGPVSGMLHAVFLLGLMMLAAPLMKLIPLAALASVLVIVAWHMVEKSQVAAIVKLDKAETVVLATTFLLTLFRDLTTGIVGGVAIGALLFMHRMAQSVAVDRDDEDQGESDADQSPDRDVAVYRLAGPFFFGAAGTAAEALERVGAWPRRFILDLAAVPFIDVTGIETMVGIARKANAAGARLYFAGANEGVARALRDHGLSDGKAVFCADVAAARAAP